MRLHINDKPFEYEGALFSPVDVQVFFGNQRQHRVRACDTEEGWIEILTFRSEEEEEISDSLELPTVRLYGNIFLILDNETDRRVMFGKRFPFSV